MVRSAPSPVTTHPLLRGFWAAALGLHVWPLLKVGGGLLGAPGDGRLWVDLGLLLLAMGFFGAKCAGVRWLRVGCPKIGAVAFLVACGIVHGDRLDPKDPAPPTMLAAVAVVSTAGAVDALFRARRRLPVLVGGAGSGLSVLIAAARGWLEAGAPVGRACASPVVAARPRGPPRRAFR
jgi:hypothetical protein